MWTGKRMSRPPPTGKANCGVAITALCGFDTALAKEMIKSNPKLVKKKE